MTQCFFFLVQYTKSEDVDVCRSTMFAAFAFTLYALVAPTHAATTETPASTTTTQAIQTYR